jgi:hypothetical protein
MRTIPRGTQGWVNSKIHSSPQTIYDISGVPLFYDFIVYRGRNRQGNIRVAANKALGDPIISTQVNPLGWNREKAREELENLVRRRYNGFSVRSTKFVCYSYPKIALMAEIVSGRRTGKILMDVGDFTEIPMEPGPYREMLGQIPYSLLSVIPEEVERENTEVWQKKDLNIREMFTRERVLEPKRFYKLEEAERLSITAELFEFIKPYTERTLDYCCHSGGCYDHDCYCGHPQENSVHCARAAAQDMLCYWRYCYTQHEIAQAYGVSDTSLTPVTAVVPGLESLTNNCFNATHHGTVNWSTCENEIQERRPFMSCVPGHARSCAGTKEWNLWVLNTPQPRYLHIYDPWPPNVGAIYWENFNTTNHMCMFTLVRRTTNHT